jgi:2'-5' RNA ligase
VVPLYVAFFPEIPAQAGWVRDFRGRHDPIAHLVAPHLTFVFPTGMLSEPDLIDEVREVAKAVSPFSAEFRTAIMMPETSGASTTSRIFLVPDRGLGDIIRLHDRLYAGRLRPELRLDLPFIPHITIAANLELTLAKTLVDELNVQDLELGCQIDHLAVVSIDDSRDARRLAARIQLAGPEGR